MSENVVCRLTAPLTGALATIAVHGPSALNLVQSIARSPGVRSQLGKPFGADGTIRNTATGTPIIFAQWPVLCGSAYEHVVLCAVDQETVEINCHGGIAVSNEIMKSLEIMGCRRVEWKDWSRILALRHRTCQSSTSTDQIDNPSTGTANAIDSTRAKLSAELSIRLAAENAILNCKSQRTAGILLDQLSGALWNSLSDLDELLRTGDLITAQGHLQELLNWSDLGLHLSQPWKVVLAGPPNVGKSSLINALTGQKHSIVHHQAGTTRDWIEVNSQIEGWPITLTDTAGLREANEVVEQEGVNRAYQRILEADLVIIVVDASAGWIAAHDRLVEICRQQKSVRCICAWNKIDLILQHLPSGEVANQRFPTAISDGLQVIRCSALNDTNELWNAIAKILVPNSPPPGTAVPFTQRQVQVLENLNQRINGPDPIQRKEKAPGCQLDWNNLVEVGDLKGNYQNEFRQ